MIRALRRRKSLRQLDTEGCKLDSWSFLERKGVLNVHARSVPDLEIDWSQ